MKGSYLISVLTASVLLFIIGVCLLVVVRAQGLSGDMRAQSRTVVELSPDVSKSQILELQNLLATVPVVDSETIHHVSRDEAYSEVYDGQVAGDDNPFLDIILFGTIGAPKETDVEELSRQLSEHEAVLQVLQDKNSMADVDQVMSRVSKVLTLGGVLMLILLVFVLYNVFKMRLMSQKKQIKIMELVGATSSFVRRPFLVDAVRIGGVSGVIAMIGVSMLALLGNLSVSPDGQIFSWVSVIGVSIAVLVLGLIVALSTTYILVNLYLKSEYK